MQFWNARTSPCAGRSSLLGQGATGRSGVLFFGSFLRAILRAPPDTWLNNGPRILSRRTTPTSNTPDDTGLTTGFVGVTSVVPPEACESFCECPDPPLRVAVARPPRWILTTLDHRHTPRPLLRKGYQTREARQVRFLSGALNDGVSDRGLPLEQGELRTRCEDPPCRNRRQGSGKPTRKNPGNVQTDNLGRGSAPVWKTGQHDVCLDGALRNNHARPPSKRAIPELSTRRRRPLSLFSPAFIQT